MPSSVSDNHRLENYDKAFSRHYQHSAAYSVLARRYPIPPLDDNHVFGAAVLAVIIESLEDQSYILLGRRSWGGKAHLGRWQPMISLLPKLRQYKGI